MNGHAGCNYPFFTSKERDIETGLDYFLARYYSSIQVHGALHVGILLSTSIGKEMSRKIEVNLDEAMQLFLFLEDLNQFFHSPTHYCNAAAVVAYVEGGMYDKLREMYYHVIPSWLPENILTELENRPSPFGE